MHGFEFVILRLFLDFKDEMKVVDSSITALREVTALSTMHWVNSEVRSRSVNCVLGLCGLTCLLYSVNLD